MPPGVVRTLYAIGVFRQPIRTRVSRVSGKLVSIFGKNVHIEAVSGSFWSNRGLYMQVISFARQGWGLYMQRGSKKA